MADRRRLFHVQHSNARSPVSRGTPIIRASDFDPDLRETLERGLEEIRCGVSEEQAEKLVRFASLVSAWAERVRLTGHRGAEEVLRRLVLESAALDSALPRFGSLADLGSGAGFPGIPIAILRPSCAVVLVESREKQHFFQRAAVRTLELENVRLLRGRAEQLEPDPQAAVVAQAMGPPQRVVEWMVPWAQPSGWLILPGGERPPELRTPRDVREPRILRYRVPLRGPRRTVWLARRITDE
jgi:16S rRNA (guanine527-N7)-methyltransferase